MCFIIDRRHASAIVADRNIKCWKVLYKANGRYFPYIQDKVCEYKPGTTMSSVSFTYNTMGTSIYAGYHSYTTRILAKRNLTVFRGPGVIRKFTIPKGTKYYYNEEHGEFVSETIRMSWRLTDVLLYKSSRPTPV